jgi:hypothetical protein
MNIIILDSDTSWLSAPKLLEGKIISYDNLTNIVTIDKTINNVDTTKKYFYAIISDDKNYISISEKSNFPVRREIAIWITAMYIIQSISLILLSNYMNDNGVYNRHIPFGTIICDMIQSDDMVARNSHSSRNMYIYGDEKIDGIELQVMMFGYFTEYAGTYYNGKFYTKDEWENAYRPILNQININKQSEKYHEIKFRDNKLQPTPIEQQRFAIKLMADYYKYIVGLLQHPIYSTRESMTNITLLLQRLVPKKSKLFAFNDKYFYINYIINDLLNHLINVKYTTFINKNYLASKKIDTIDLDNFGINSANIFIKNENLRNIFIKYIMKKRGAFEIPSIKYLNDMILFGLCFFKAINYMDPPILILITCLKLLIDKKISDDTFKNVIIKCSNNVKFSDELYNELINKDYPMYINIPTFASHLTNKNVKIIPIDEDTNDDEKYENVRNYYGSF